MQNLHVHFPANVDSCAWKNPSRKREENSVWLPVARVMDDCMPGTRGSCPATRLRATVEAGLAKPDWKVEIVVTAAVWMRRGQVPLGAHPGPVIWCPESQNSATWRDFCYLGHVIRTGWLPYIANRRSTTVHMCVRVPSFEGGV